MPSIVILLLIALYPLCSQSASNQEIWPANVISHHVRDDSDIYLSLRNASPSSDLIEYQNFTNHSYISLYAGNLTRWDSKFKNLVQVDIYRNGKQYISLLHHASKSSNSSNNAQKKILYIADQYLLPTNTHKVAVKMYEKNGDNHDLLISRNVSPISNNKDLIKRFDLNIIKWKTGLDEYRLFEINEGIALANLRSEFSSYGIINDYYGRCIVKNSEEYITGYEYKIKNKFLAPDGIIISRASVKDKLQYIEFNHRLLTPLESRPSEYNQMLQVELNLTCKTSANRKFVDKRLSELAPDRTEF